MDGVPVTMTTFKTGDLVFLNSGGPVVTVRFQSGNQVEVDWFNDDDPMHGVYFAAQLVPAEEITATLEAADATTSPGTHITLVRDNDKGSE